MTTLADRPLEEQIAQWRTYLRRRQAIHGSDVEELEGHLRDQLVALTAAGAVFANVFPFPTRSDTQVLTVLHLPIALWLAVGFTYVRHRGFAGDGRMNFVRFSGELGRRVPARVRLSLTPSPAQDTSLGLNPTGSVFGFRRPDV